VNHAALTLIGCTGSSYCAVEIRSGGSGSTQTKGHQTRLERQLAVIAMAASMAVLAGPAATARPASAVQCSDAYSTRWAKHLIVRRLSCQRGELVANLFVNSLNAERGTPTRFRIRPQRWFCRQTVYTYHCNSRRASLSFVSTSSRNLICRRGELYDDIDGFGMDPQAIGTGGLTCAIVLRAIQAMYDASLQARNNSHREYAIDGARWSCVVSSYPRHDGYFSGTENYTCDGQPSRSNTLTQELNFFLHPRLVTVECDQPGFCTEEAPMLNGDYGDQNDYAAAGLTIQSNPNGSGPGPAAGQYNRLALCRWKDLGRSGPDEQWKCVHP
jgi:hypothetical protein